MSEVENMVQAIVDLIRGAIGLAGTAFLFYLMIFNPITQSVLAGMEFSRQFRHEQVVAIQDENYRFMCREYKNVSTWKKWTSTHYRELAWCERYLDRL